MMPRKNKVLIVLMSSGENELDACKESLFLQEGLSFDFFHIEDRPNKEAHHLCYKKIMQEKDNYSYFLKLDGDMVFAGKDKLRKMIDMLLTRPDIDHASFSVLDWASQKSIIGMHVFSGRCQWQLSEDEVFVDPSPKYPGKKIIVWNSPAPVAWHSPEPDIKQAIQFGCHRALKIVQRDRKLPSLARSSFQFNLMEEVFQQYCIEKDIKRLAVLFGVEKVFRHSGFTVLHSKQSSVFDDLVLEFENAEARELEKKIQSRWGANLGNPNFFFSSVKFKLWLRAFFFRVLGSVIPWIKY